eukprot:TRINITY_DN17797_c0_g2_i1.p1 TRINITY_DN17797_c0_g2~~TRINITY_DN17797_c0_g2_i1.p1  ORF type:complete len:293 (+),score=22.66 TRINITY_DN17797_c0_g2_i1:70-948(+)
MPAVEGNALSMSVPDCFDTGTLRPYAALCLAVLLTMALLLLHRALSRLYIRIASCLCPTADSCKQVQNIVKQQRELVCYFILVAAGCIVVPRQDFLWHGEACWDCLSIPWDLALYYAFQIGVYAQLMIIDVLDRCDKDGPEAMDAPSWVHHCICLVLAAGTLLPGYVRIGAVTFFLHDPSSLVLKLARVHYLAGLRKRAKLCFMIFAVLFFSLRLVCYPIIFWQHVFYYAPGNVPSGILVPLAFIMSLIILMNCAFMVKIVLVLLRGDGQGPAGQREALLHQESSVDAQLAQ